MNTKTEVIKKYDVMFAARTGVTIMIPKTPALDHEDRQPVFWQSDAESCDILIGDENHAVQLQDMKKDMLAEALSRGFIMFYETLDNEVVRCTTCRLRKHA